MPLRVVYYELAHERAVRAFNARLRAANALIFAMPETAPAPNPGKPVPGIEFRYFLVVDDGGEVRGGYFIRMQPFWIHGQVHTVGHYQAPLSEGVIDKRYAAVGAVMLAHALEQQPLLFAMGMGGMDRPLPRMLRARGWPILEIPFYFLILNARQFLRNIGSLRATRGRRIAADLLASSGLGTVAINGIQMARRRGRFDNRYNALATNDFADWADRVWQTNAAQYSFAAVRNAEYLRFIYPPAESIYYGIRLTAGDMPAGWVELLACRFRERSYFGEMRVAALVDGVAPAPVIPSLVSSAVDAARARAADIVISNQMHRDWTAALQAAGFWKGPSNYLLAMSKELQKLVGPLGDAGPRIHFNRGDGDGRVNLVEYTEPSS